jgi:hypothetical protein
MPLAKVLTGRMRTPLGTLALLAVATSLAPAAATLSPTPLLGFEPARAPLSAAAAGWRLDGDAALATADGLEGAAGLADGAVRLTPDVPGRAGALFATRRAARLGSRWRAEAVVRVHGAGTSLAGEGIALW